MRSQPFPQATLALALAASACRPSLEDLPSDNLPPGAPTITVAPVTPQDEQDLVCSIAVDSIDPEGDPVSYAFTWTVDGVPWTGSVAASVHPGDTIPASETTVGEVWTCVVTPSDAVAAGTPATAQVTIAQHPCLVGYWPFDEGSGASAGDMSGNDNDGTLVGEASWTSGAVGGAIALDGDGDYIEMGDILNDIRLPVTLSAWVWIDDDGMFNLMNTDDDAYYYSGFWLQVDPENRFWASFGDGAGGDGYQWRRSVASDPVVARRAWTHLAVAIRGAEDMSIYIDGVAATTTYDGSGGGLSTSDYPFHVGREVFGATNMDADGVIDELRVHNCVLDDAEIAAIAIAD